MSERAHGRWDPINSESGINEACAARDMEVTWIDMALRGNYRMMARYDRKIRPSPGI